MVKMLRKDVEKSRLEKENYSIVLGSYSDCQILYKGKLDGLRNKNFSGNNQYLKAFSFVHHLSHFCKNVTKQDSCAHYTVFGVYI